MGKMAFVFSGQGAQFTGMGKELWEESPAARTVFQMVDEIRPGTTTQCFQAAKEELSLTKNTQPCLFAVGLAAAKALEERGLRAEGVAGFSLGEIAAMGFAGGMSAETAFRVVCARANFMQEAAESSEGAMCAVLGLSAAQVERLAASYKTVQAVNYNCPGQIVVAGSREELEAFSQEGKAQGGKIRPLAVSGAFHSRYMDGAARKFGEFLQGVDVKLPKLPVYANVTARPYEGEVRKWLEEQVNHPVRWQETIERMVEDGFTDFVEVGAGKVLCGLIGRIAPQATARPYQEVLQDFGLREA